TSKSRMAAAPDIPTVDEAGLPGFYSSVWAGVWGAKGHAEERDREARCGNRRCLGRLDSARAIDEPGARDFPARSTDAGRSRRAAKGRDRKMVADHQGGGHQG